MIATATAGGGHLQAAAAIEEAWNDAQPKDQVKRVDILAFTPKLYRKAYSEGYVKLAEKTPELYAHAFRKTDTPAFIKKATRLRRFTARFVAYKFIRLVDEWKPDVVLCPHFLPMETLGSIRGHRGHHQPRIVTVVTDFEAHALWMEPSVDLYCVAMEETKARLVARGVPPKQIVVTGIPISRRFRKAPSAMTLRRRLRLNPTSPTLLVLGGGLGMGPLAETMRYLNEVKRPLQLLVVAGKNEALRRTLERKRWKHPTRVFGFVTRMEELMTVAEAVVTKPGGLTTSEALALGKPLVIVNPLPGQEAANSDFLLERGAAVKINRLEDIPYRLETLLKGKALASLAKRARVLGKPDAAGRVVKLVRSSLLVLSLCLGLGGKGFSKCSLENDEQLTFFPTVAWQTPSQEGWQASVHGWVYEPEADSALRQKALSALARALELPPGSEASDLFRQRAAFFLVDNERNKTFEVQIQTHTVSLSPSDAFGHTETVVSLPATYSAVTNPAPISFSVPGCEKDTQVTQGTIQAIPLKGLSVISDIDDTIKQSDVGQTRALLERTFLKPYEAVSGMAEAYQALASQGAVFHYVSASPWQLFPALQDFLKTSGYPNGTLFLKKLRVKTQSAWGAGLKSDQAKRPAIEKLLKRYPQREFILVGDAGERDPELYSDLARQYGSQLRLVAIRDSAGSGTEPRYRKAFRGLPPMQWVVFRTPDDFRKATARVPFLIATDWEGSESYSYRFRLSR